MDNNQPNQLPPIPPKETPKKPSWSPITFGIIIFAVGFLLGYVVGGNKGTDGNNLITFLIPPTPTIVPTSVPTPTPTLSPLACKYQTYPGKGRSPEKDKFLKTYTFAEGDTITSITQTQLGDVSRVNELITLNKEVYPNLSLESPTLPVGSKLYITPKEFPVNSGDLHITEGIVTQSDPGGFVIKATPSPNSGGINVDIRSNTKWIGKQKSIKVGDCLSVIMDYAGNYTHNGLVIMPQ